MTLEILIQFVEVCGAILLVLGTALVGFKILRAILQMLD